VDESAHAVACVRTRPSVHALSAPTTRTNAPSPSTHVELVRRRMHPRGRRGRGRRSEAVRGRGTRFSSQGSARTRKSRGPRPRLHTARGRLGPPQAQKALPGEHAGTSARENRAHPRPCAERRGGDDSPSRATVFARRACCPPLPHTPSGCLAPHAGRRAHLFKLLWKGNGGALPPFLHSCGTERESERSLSAPRDRLRPPLALFLFPSAPAKRVPPSAPPRQDRWATRCPFSLNLSPFLSLFFTQTVSARPTTGGSPWTPGTFPAPLTPLPSS